MKSVLGSCITHSCDLTLTPYEEHCRNRALMENEVLIMMLCPVNVCLMSMCGFFHHLYIRKYVVVVAVTAVCVFSVVRRVQQTKCDVSHFVYFCKMLYMFQTVFPSIIRSSKLHIQR